MLNDLPDLGDPQLQKDYESCLERIKQIAQQLREEKFGRFTVANTPAATVDYASLTRPSRPRQTDYITLPLHKAAIVIGHNGEGLKRIEKMAQVKLQLDIHYRAHDERRLLINGYPEDIEEAKRIVSEGAMAGGQASSLMLVPQSRIGLVIGKGGETIRELQERSGAKIMVAPDLATMSSAGDKATVERIVTILGDPSAIQRAKDLIDEVVFGVVRRDNADNAGGTGNGNSGNSPLLAANELTVQVPEACVGAIIGKKAENLRAMQAISGCKVFIEPHAVPGQNVRNVHLAGPPEAIAYAQQLLEDKIATIDSAYGGGYGYDVAGGGIVYQAAGEFSGAPNSGGVVDGMNSTSLNALAFYSHLYPSSSMK